MFTFRVTIDFIGQIIFVGTVQYSALARTTHCSLVRRIAHRIVAEPDKMSKLIAMNENLEARPTISPRLVTRKQAAK